MLKKIIFLSLSFTILTLCGQPGPEDFANFKGGEADPIETEVIVPFELQDSAHRITVIADFDGTELEMILDTGGQTFIEKNLKDKLELDSFIVPANNSEFSVIKTIGLGDVKVNNLKVGLIEFEDTFKFDLNGMIGSDFMRFYQVSFNYQQEQLSFSQNKYMGDIDDKDHIVPIDIIFPYFPTVDMVVNGKDEFPGMIDTGLHYAFVFPVSWIDNLEAEQRSELIPAEGYFARWPWHEDPDNYLYKMETIEIGDLKLENVPVIFSEIPVFLNDTTALIGKFFLENYLTTLDYPGRQVNFREQEKVGRSLSFSAGVMLAEKDEKLQITGVWQGSPAAEAGLSPDLQLLAVEGKEYGEITNRELSEIMLDPDVKEFTITFYKDGTRQEIELQKRELLK